MRELVGARIQKAREAEVLKKPREATLPLPLYHVQVV
jgi:hypothetical protein